MENQPLNLMPAYAVYKGQKPGDKVKEEHIALPKVVAKRKRGKSLQDVESRKKRKKISPKKASSHKSNKTKSVGVKKQIARKVKEEMETTELSNETESEGDDGHRPFTKLFNIDEHEDSAVAGRALFELLINPYTVDEFLSDFWEKKPVLIKRRALAYHDGWFSSDSLDTILEQNSLQYSVNINIASYENGQRSTHNPSGRAYATTVREFYEQGCSIQLLNPQTYSKEMWKLTATLQEFFGCFVGANVYLTPPGTQGFAPHYDDIEAFVMQIEGKKQWRLYKPPTVSDVLPRTSSKNFQQSELSDLLLDVVLEPGDLLYFPRGTVHQANAMPDTHSLHITLSTFQRNTWGNLFEKLIPAALQTALSEDDRFRKGLPINYLSYMGIVHEKHPSPLRKTFIEMAHLLMDSVVNSLSFDEAADEMGLDFIHSSLPPCITDKEKDTGIWKPASKTGNNAVEITLDTRIRLVRRGSIRMVYNEDKGTVLYYNTNNTRVYQENEPEGMEIGSQDEVIIKYLVQLYPEYVSVQDLPSDDDENKIDVAYMLYNKAVIVMDSNSN